MKLPDFESLRLLIEDSYRNLLLGEWELALRPRARINISRRTIEVHCYRIGDAADDVAGRTPLGEPLVYTFQEAKAFGPAELGRMLDHFRLAINLNKLL